MTLADMAALVTGALGWTPVTFWNESTLMDALLALAGFMMIHRPERFQKSGVFPDSKFLSVMAGRFPD